MSEPAEHEFAEIADAEDVTDDRLSVLDLNRMKLNITADLGTCSMKVREVLELERGSLVQLDKLAGEMADVFVNGLPLARGEIVVLGDTLHIRIGEIQGGTSRSQAADEMGD